MKTSTTRNWVKSSMVVSTKFIQYLRLALFFGGTLLFSSCSFHMYGDEIASPPKGKQTVTRSDGKVVSQDVGTSSYARNKIVWPAKGWLSSKYGMRKLRGRKRKFHHGIDIAAPTGAPIRAASQGVVKFVGWKTGYGRTVIISHNGFRTLYAHASKIHVRKGQKVGAGKRIADIGRSGNARGAHLHFEYRKQDNRSVDPLAKLPRSRQLLSMR